MDIRYQAGKTGAGEFGAYLGLNSIMTFIKGKVNTQGGVRIIKGVGNDPGPILEGNECFKRARNFLDSAKPGDKVTFLPDTGPFNWTIRVAEYDPTPDSFFAGKPAIDRIAKDVYTRFNDTYGIVNLGICVNKPGEHGICNAWDIGVHKPTSSTAIHVAILTIGNYLRNRMLADMEGEPGLPVNGVIVMEQICSREDKAWHYYSGIAHVSHVHVSGWPNPLPGWV